MYALLIIKYLPNTGIIIIIICKLIIDKLRMIVFNNWAWIFYYGKTGKKKEKKNALIAIIDRAHILESKRPLMLSQKKKSCHLLSAFDFDIDQIVLLFLLGISIISLER